MSGSITGAFREAVDVEVLASAINKPPSIGTNATRPTRIAINSALMQLRLRRSQSEVSFHQHGDNDQSREALAFPDSSPNAEQVYMQSVRLLTRSHTRSNGFPRVTEAS